MITTWESAVFDDCGGVRDVYLRLDRTSDVFLISRIVEHPEIKPQIWDSDDSVSIPLHETIYHLVARLDGEVVGLVSFVPINSITWNPHISILPKYRGRGTDVMRLGINWMFENTPCIKLVAFPPTFKKAMIRVFEKCGFEHEGFSSKSFRFNDVIYDRLLMGLEKD